ncbi:hypothetical protein NRIC_00420 [Enterococcus florum]|uniref:Uncharacterized protein n=1 Tax=Enterococcus florum TaxID=2480627 RepID=A0A4P5P7I5_9ENTE|nr:hypothetical protein [Enterococcus florum]GCF92151.1 hypothetical protein NRIC_00420 [Enterococcus florum]
MDEIEEKVEVSKKNEMDYANKAKGVYASIKEHLTVEYRKQYNIRRLVGCLLMFLFIRYMGSTSETDSLISRHSTVPLIWTVIAFIFWHYAYWSYQGGVIDTFSRNIIYVGSIWSLIWKIVVQNIVIQIWIAFIAPISGIKTWRKAVKHNKILFVNNDKDDVWK